MELTTKIAKWLKREKCKRLIEQKKTEVEIDRSGFDAGVFKIDIGKISTNQKEFYKASLLSISLDNTQYYLCDQISKIEDETLKDDCIRIRLQIIIAINQFIALLEGSKFNQEGEISKELVKWIRFMNRLNKQGIDNLSSKKTKSVFDKNKRNQEIKQIMDYQAINEKDMENAIKLLK